MYGGQKRISGVLLCHSLLYALETEPLTEPGAGLQASKALVIPSLLLTVQGHRRVLTPSFSHSAGVSTSAAHAWTAGPAAHRATFPASGFVLLKH